MYKLKFCCVTWGSKVAALLFVKYFVSLTVAPVTNPKMLRALLLLHSDVAFRRRRQKKTRHPVYFLRCFGVSYLSSPTALLPSPQKKRREANVEPSFGKVQRPKVANASTGSSNGRTSGGRKCMQYWRCAVLWLAVVNCEPGKDLSAIQSSDCLT